MSVHSWCIYILTIRPTLVWPCVVVPKWISRMNSSLLLYQCLQWVLCLSLVVCEMEDKWLYSCCFLTVPSKICSKLQATFLCSSDLALFPRIASVSTWFVHTLLLTQLQPGRSPILFHRRDQICEWPVNSNPLHRT